MNAAAPVPAIPPRAPSEEEEAPKPDDLETLLLLLMYDQMEPFGPQPVYLN